MFDPKPWSTVDSPASPSIITCNPHPTSNSTSLVLLFHFPQLSMDIRIPKVHACHRSSFSITLSRSRTPTNHVSPPSFNIRVQPRQQTISKELGFRFDQASRYSTWRTAHWSDSQGPPVCADETSPGTIQQPRLRKRRRAKRTRQRTCS